MTKSKHELLKDLDNLLQEGPVHPYTISEILKSHNNSSKEEIAYAISLLMQSRAEQQYHDDRRGD